VRRLRRYVRSMATELNEVELQVLSAVRDNGVPTTDAEVADRTGLTREAIREALRSLGDDYLLVRPHGQDPDGDVVEVLDFKGDGAVPRPPSTDWETR
jgi:DNA-directed RNA polymerase sigma subunit (sigma70/sigma32)